MREPRTRAAALAALLMIASHPGQAVDGVIELSQACVSTGCLSGDPGGFPIEITGPGSYRLTSNLTLPDENTSAILLRPDADGATLDLNGFSIEGVNRCAQAAPGMATACISPGTGDGIEMDLTAAPDYATSVTVRNGRIFGTGRYGIFLARHGSVLGVHVEQCGDIGIFTGHDSEVHGNAAVLNGGVGLRTSAGSSITSNRALSNAGVGIAVAGVSAVENNSSRENGGNGFDIGAHSAVHNNVSVANGGHGFDVSGVNSLLRGNTANVNAMSGIDIGSGLVVSNVLSDNDIGLSISGEAGYRSNMVEGNTSDAVSGGVNLGENHCSGTGTTSASCP